MSYCHGLGHEMTAEKIPRNTVGMVWEKGGSVLVPGQPSTNIRNRVRITTRVRKRLYLDCRNHNRAWL